MHHKIQINRAPVLTLWAAVVAERLGLDRAEALTFDRALSGLTAQAKGVRLGIFEPALERDAAQKKLLKAGEAVSMLLGRSIPAVQTPDGLRALSKDKPIAPTSVERYLRAKFGDALDDARSAMTALVRSLEAAELAHRAFALHQRP